MELVPPERRTLDEFRRWSRRMLERCRRLQVGDHVRFVQIPSSADWPSICFPPETLRLYKRLIARRRPSRVIAMDECGLPWIAYRFRGSDGRMERHSLAIDDESWVRARRRAPRR
jgi:hypothetical protein